MFFNN